MKCSSKTTSGSKCKCRTIRGSKFCYFHHPNMRDKRKKSQSNGGKNNSTMLLTLPDIILNSANDVRILLSETINHLRKGMLDEKICRTIGYLSQVTLKSIEQSSLEDRLTNIENILKKADED